MIVELGMDILWSEYLTRSAWETSAIGTKYKR